MYILNNFYKAIAQLANDSTGREQMVKTVITGLEIPSSMELQFEVKFGLEYDKKVIEISYRTPDDTLNRIQFNVDWARASSIIGFLHMVTLGPVDATLIRYNSETHTTAVKINGLENGIAITIG